MRRQSRRGVQSLLRSGRVAKSRWQLHKRLAPSAYYCTEIYPNAHEFPSHLLSIPPTKITTLDNKFRVASEYKAGEMATVGVWIDAGSVWENEETNGVAHFLEHMAFKGTGSRSRKDIELEIENVGGSLNAYTSREQTVYYAHVFKDDIPKAVEILSDILQNSKFDEADINRERSVILREMEEVETQTEEVIFDHLHSVAYQGTSLGYTILGPEKNIRRISRDDLRKYIDTHYRAPRMVLAAAGAVDHDQLTELGNKHFGNLRSDVEERPNEVIPFTPSMVTVRNDAMPLIHVAVAAEAISWTDPDYFSFMLLQTMVGSWDRSLGSTYGSSYPCEFLATSDMAHSLMSFNSCYHNTGLFGFYLVTPPEHGFDALHIVMEEWVRIATSATDQEVERAKEKLKSSFLMQLDGSNSTCEDIGRQVLTLGRRMTPAEIFLRIDSIDTKSLKAVAYKYLYDCDPAVAAIGKVDAAKFPDYNQIQSWTYWNRY